MPCVQGASGEIPAPGRSRLNRNAKARDRYTPPYVRGGLARFTQQWQMRDRPLSRPAARCLIGDLSGEILRDPLFNARYGAYLVIGQANPIHLPLIPTLGSEPHPDVVNESRAPPDCSVAIFIGSGHASRREFPAAPAASDQLIASARVHGRRKNQSAASLVSHLLLI